MNSKKQHKYKLYLDRNIGTFTVPIILKKNNIEFEIHDEHLPQDSHDEEWVKLCSIHKWIAITLDKRLVNNSPVKQAAKNSNISIFIIPYGNMRGTEIAELIVKYHKKILNFSISSKKPFLAILSKNGSISLKRFP